MVKIKSGDTIALDKSKQKEVTKQTKEIKRKLKSGEISIKEKRKQRKAYAEKRRGLVYVAHLPHGFYEEQVREYFKQFGRVTNVKICRSSKTGNSKGYGYVEFARPEVGKIAADTMNNYLMFKRRIIAEYVEADKRPKYLFSAENKNLNRISVKVRRQKQAFKQNVGDGAAHLKRTHERLAKLAKKLLRLKECGIDYAITPVEKGDNLIIDDSLAHLEPKSPAKVKKSKVASISAVAKKVTRATKPKAVIEATKKLVVVPKSIAKPKAVIEATKRLVLAPTSILAADNKPKNKNKGWVVDEEPLIESAVVKKSKSKSKLASVLKKKLVSKKQKSLDVEKIKTVAKNFVAKGGDELVNLVKKTKAKSSKILKK